MSSFDLRAVLVVASLALVGCPSTPNSEPPDAFREDGGRRDAFIENGDAGDDAGTPGDVGIDAFVAADADVDAHLDDGAVPDAFTCDDPTGCYRCAPSTVLQFLNHCTGAGIDCEPFPVTIARLPRLRADGTVPPLP